jgi:hypothetical protein
MPRTFTFTPNDQDQIFAITVIRDELTVVNVSDGNTKLQLSISTTRGGSPIIQIPSTGGKFDLRPSLLESLDEGMTYQHNIWDYSNSVDGKRIAIGTFTHAESIKSVDIAYPTVTLADGTLRIFVTQAQYNAIDPKDSNVNYVIIDANGEPILIPLAVGQIAPVSEAVQAGGIAQVQLAGAVSGGISPYTYSVEFPYSMDGSLLLIPLDDLIDADVSFVVMDSAGQTSGGVVSVKVIFAGQMTLRQQIEELGSSTAAVGRKSTSSLKVVGVDALPSGVTLSGKIITMSGTGAVLSDWDLSDYKVNLGGSDNQVVNNVWNAAATSTLGAWYFIDVNPAAVNPIIEYNTFDGFDGYGGPGTFINMNTTGYGAAATGAVGARIRYNRCLKPGGDVMKVSGNDTLIEWNYFGPVVNAPAGTSEWEAGATYDLGQAIFYEENKLFFSKVAGNVGNTPPSSKTDSTFWHAVDPHCDGITVTGSNGVGVEVVNNLFDWQEDAVRGVGITQAIRVVRNTGSADNMGPVRLARNVISPIFAGFYPLGFGLVREYTDVTNVKFKTGDLVHENGVNYVSLQGVNEGNLPSASPEFWEVVTDIYAPGPISVSDNWVGSGRLGAYYSQPVPPAVDSWSNNRDAIGDALIDPPTLRDKSRQVAASLGQSEQAISLFKYAAAANKQAHPPLLSGVDGILFVSGKNSDSGLPEKIPMTLTEIQAGRINPGATAYFNFMHHVSGGRPQALVDITWSGTGMESMMDDDNTARDYFVDEASVANAFDAGFPVDLGVYAWSNAEASVARELIEGRNPHLIGRNGDGSPYDFVTGDLEHCFLDTTNRGFGLLPNTAKLSMMFFHHRALDPSDPISPPNLGYLTKSDGAAWGGMTGGNRMPAAQSRKDFMAQTYLDANRGKVGVAQAIALYGDYVDGVRVNGGESGIHPSILEPDGQILAAQHFAAHVAYNYGYLQIPSAPTFTTSSDGLTVIGQVTLPAGTTLETIRRVKGQTVASPRPHQQPVMGISIWRNDGSFSEFELRPLWRVGQGPSAAYEGTVAILDAAAGTFKITLSQALANGDIIDFGGDGQYGGFSIYGQPDYAARMYQDALIAHDPALYTATGYYGVPVEPQVRHTVTRVGTSVDTTAPVLSAPTASPIGTNGYEGTVTTDEAGGMLYWLIQPAATAPPSSAQVEAGASVAVNAVGQKTVSGSGLSAATAYRIYFVHKDAAGNVSAVATPVASFTTSAVAEAFASRTAIELAYLTGPNIVAGTEAITVVLDMSVPDGATGFTEIMEYTGGVFKLLATLNAGSRQVQVTVRDGGNANVFGAISGPTNSFPTGRHTYVFTATLNNATGGAQMKVFTDGVEVVSATGTAATKTFSTARSLELFNALFEGKFYSARVYAGSHAQGYTNIGDVTGLTLLHSVAGAKSNWNSPVSGLVKAGAAPFA